MINSFSRFLNSNATIREKILNYSLFKDIKLAAARKRVDIKIYVPEIDKDGYDIILESDYTIKHIQLKSILGSSKTSHWYVRKSIIRPRPWNTFPLGYEQSPEGEGIEGGLILMKAIIKNEEIERVEYYYTDCYLLSAVEKGLIRLKNAKDQAAILRMINVLKKGYSREKIRITKSALMKVESIDHLLGLGGMPSIHENNWHEYYRQHLDKPSNKTMREEAVGALKKLISDKRMKIE